MPQQNNDYYDNLHRSSIRSWEHYSRSKYYDMYRRICQILWQENVVIVHDLGCGPGTLGMMLKDFGFSYSGVDISGEAVKMAKRRGLCVYHADITQHVDSCGAYVCTETMEHIDDDMSVLDKMRAKALLIFSVPTFMDPSHVRCFKSPKEIRKRYSNRIDIESIEAFPRRHLVKARVL